MDFLRCVAEALGFEVKWDKQMRLIIEMER